MDRTDRKLLLLLQQDCTLSLAALSNAVGLSATPCWNRIQRLEAEGVIERRVALADPQKVGLGLSTFVAIEARDHSAEWLDRFATAIAGMPKVIEAHRMAGDIDDMLHVVTTDLAAYDAFYERLIAAVSPKNVSARMSMERIMRTTALPLPEAAAKRKAHK